MCSKELGSVRSFQRSDENAETEIIISVASEQFLLNKPWVLWGMFGIILKLVHSSNGIHM